MGDTDKKLIEKLEADFQGLSSKNAWTPEDLEKMKNLQKLMYYIEVRCAMKEGGEYPGEQYMDERSYDSRSYGGNSYARGGQNRSPSTGRFTSGHYPMSYNSYNSYDNMSGRRYYDDERGNLRNDLQRMLMSEKDPMIRQHMENLAGMLG